MSMTLLELLEESREIVAIARAVRMMPDYWPEWLERKEYSNGLATAGVGIRMGLVSGSVDDDRHRQAGKGPRRKLTAASLPTEPAFTARMNAAYDLAHANDLPAPEHDHKRRSNAWLSHPGNCADGSCLARRLRKQMANNQPGSLLWEQARREAERYGVLEGVR